MQPLIKSKCIAAKAGRYNLPQPQPLSANLTGTSEEKKGSGKLNKPQKIFYPLPNFLNGIWTLENS
jgi:hypothetical protein